MQDENEKGIVIYSEMKNFPKINISLKDFYISQQIQFLLKDVIGKEGLLPHGNDGLIFT